MERSRKKEDSIESVVAFSISTYTKEDVCDQRSLKISIMAQCKAAAE
jgi:hypothetical protein